MQRAPASRVVGDVPAGEPAPAPLARWFTYPEGSPEQVRALYEEAMANMADSDEEVMAWIESVSDEMSAELDRTEPYDWGEAGPPAVPGRS